MQKAAEELDVKIVVFIDDLDRCLPEKAVELLEGLKVLLDLKNFIFVLGVAREVIERGVKLRYKDLHKQDSDEGLSALETHYLDKIIQFPFTLPTADAGKLRDMMRDNLHALLGNGNDNLVDLIHDSLGRNPRTIKRFINAISFAIFLNKARKDIDFKHEPLIKVSLLGYLLPELYRQVEIYPGHLVRLEKQIQAGEKLTKTEDESGVEQSIKTSQTIIDKWLSGENYIKLRVILRGIAPQEGGQPQRCFTDEDEVSCYLSLMAPSLQAETAGQDDEDSLAFSVMKEMHKRMVKIDPNGPFLIGENNDSYSVLLTPFFIDKYPVTQDIYEMVMGENPSKFKDKARPVEQVSWFDAVNFCNKLSEHTGKQAAYEITGDLVKLLPDADGFRLPTEAQWEYACQGKVENGKSYADEEMDVVAWGSKNSKGKTQCVGGKKANEFGLYDMLGNVSEWCEDWYGVYPSEEKKDYRGPEEGKYKMLRGGNWEAPDLRLTPKNRYKHYPQNKSSTYGFRVVLPK